ncbi:MAG: LptF/LptG family permease [Sedimentisphaerales bacterium]|nr:LptF/LptG family permease [Sedimentisphaerales bacterium]
MVFTLHRYIFRDLLKTFALATVVLSGVLGLGVMLPLLRRFSVDPGQVPQLFLYTLPVTLTMVIPIAALLSATLNYGRLSAFNEVNACRASGISMMTLIYPALVLALLVGLATILLAFHVIPYYAARCERMLASDAEKFLFRTIEKKGYLGDMFPDWLIHADRAYYDQHVLTGVVVGQLDHNAKGLMMTRIFSCSRVYVQFDASEGENCFNLRLIDPTVVDNDTGAITKLEESTLSIPFPSLFRDDIKFKNLADLKAIQNDMTRFGPLRDNLLEVRRQLMVEMFFEWCDRQFYHQGFIDMTNPQGRILRVHAGGCELKRSSSVFDLKKAEKNRNARMEPSAIVGEEKSIRIEEYLRPGDRRSMREFTAAIGNLTVAFDQDVPVVMISLDKVTRTTRGESQTYYLAREDFTRLKPPPGDYAVQASELSLPQARQSPLTAWLHGEPSPYLNDKYTELTEDVHELALEIKAELHSRLAFGVSCVALVLLGTALGIYFRSGHLLTAFGVSFIPAALCLITIFTGKHLAVHSSLGVTAGLAFLWSGIIVAAVGNLAIYKLLLKH